MCQSSHLCHKCTDGLIRLMRVGVKFISLYNLTQFRTEVLFCSVSVLFASKNWWESHSTPPMSALLHQMPTVCQSSHSCLKLWSDSSLVSTSADHPPELICLQLTTFLCDNTVYEIYISLTCLAFIFLLLSRATWLTASPVFINLFTGQSYIRYPQRSTLTSNGQRWYYRLT